MSTQHRIILNDEFDWNYANDISRENMIKHLNSIEGVEVMPSPYCMIIFEWCKLNIEEMKDKVRTVGVVYDSAYYQKDTEPEIVRVWK